MVHTGAICAAASESGSLSGGVRTFVAGPEMAKNIRSTPMPAANSIDAQVKRLNCGREWSGPKRISPNLLNATVSTKMTMSAAVRT